MVDTQLNKASTFSFELSFPKIPSETNIKVNEELVLNIFNTVIPGITMESNEESWQGTKSKMATGEFSFEDWSLSFVVDSDFKNWKIIYEWLMFINNSKNKYIKKHSIYTIDATLMIIDNFQKNVFSLKFIDLWPTNLGSINLNYREGDVNLECQATFVYDRYEILNDF